MRKSNEDTRKIQTMGALEEWLKRVRALVSLRSFSPAWARKCEGFHPCGVPPMWVTAIFWKAPPQAKGHIGFLHAHQLNFKCPRILHILPIFLFSLKPFNHTFATLVGTMLSAGFLRARGVQTLSRPLFRAPLIPQASISLCNRILLSKSFPGMPIGLIFAPISSILAGSKFSARSMARERLFRWI
jgi:hypothetical protein